jgi:hypothetical protein
VRPVSIEIGILLVAVGALAAIVGLTSRRNAQHLRDFGRQAWGLVIAPPADHEPPALAVIRYALPSGKLVERTCRQPARRSAVLQTGEQVRIWYDIADPGEILIDRRDGHQSDTAFIVVGLLFMLIGVAYLALVR